jgi:hypothetical protein
MSVARNTDNHSLKHHHSAPPDYLATGNLLSDNELLRHHSLGVPFSRHHGAANDQVVGHVEEHADHRRAQHSSEI